uniref:Uncharacterized protein n=1 Tax=Acanthochromis polyacanthus TaxID=80966 RepID=A0A3Q1GJA2_9TELE
NSAACSSAYPSNAFGNTALHVACFNGQDAVVSDLIDYGANVSQPNNKGFTPLHFAAASTHGALCLEFLVNNGADVNVQVRRTPDTCPLFTSSCSGCINISRNVFQNLHLVSSETPTISSSCRWFSTSMCPDLSSLLYSSSVEDVSS